MKSKKANSFVQFFGESTAWNFAFEINWPLVLNKCLNGQGLKVPFFVSDDKIKIPKSKVVDTGSKIIFLAEKKVRWKKPLHSAKFKVKS